MRVVTPERMREIEGRAIRDLEIDGLLLMERAALALAREIRQEGCRSVLAVCGVGNNGGDAYACARILHLWGVRVTLLPLCGQERLTGDAQKNARICARLRIPSISLDEVDASRGYDAVIDGIFGTGLSRAPEGIFARAIDWINGCGAKVYSVDIPSGIDGATGRALGGAVRADVTVTFQWAKRGHYLSSAPSHTGRLIIEDIGIPDPPSWEGDAEILLEEEARALLRDRPRDAYKNQFGHALLVAGSHGMAGAAVLCATACMRAGVGLLTVCAPEQSVVPHVQSRLPVAMCAPLREDAAHRYPADAGQALLTALEGKTAVGYGCGVGRAPDRALPLEAALHSRLPAVIDADGLYHLASRLDLLDRAAETVLTPHPGEMARLLGRPVADPVEDARCFARAHQCVVLLKGALTVIAAPDCAMTFNVNGTSGMATAGSGDALTGVILALLAQGLSAYDAARAGAYFHAQAGLRAQALYGNASMNALDIAENIRL